MECSAFMPLARPIPNFGIIVLDLLPQTSHYDMFGRPLFRNPFKLLQLHHLVDNLPISEVTGKAFDILGHNGLIHAATHHSCLECSHPYKQSINDNPTTASTNGMDIDEDSVADVQMVVLDEIVIGPTVSFDIIIKHI